MGFQLPTSTQINNQPFVANQPTPFNIPPSEKQGFNSRSYLGKPMVNNA